MYGELYIPPERKMYNPTNGQFLKGHEPVNKGKPWEKWMSKRGQRRAKKGWVNIDIHRPKERPDNAGRCRVQVIAVKDDGAWLVLPYIGAAGDWIGGCRENVSEHYLYWEDHVNHNPLDCCNLRLPAEYYERKRAEHEAVRQQMEEATKPRYIQGTLFEDV